MAKTKKDGHRIVNAAQAVMDAWDACGVALGQSDVTALNVAMDKLRIEMKAAPFIRDPIGHVTCHGVVGVSFYENCEYGTSLTVGTKIYLGA